MFTIDGQEFSSVRVSALSRGFEITDGGNEGYSLSGLHIRDIIGTYITYTITIDPDLMSPAEYDRLFEILLSPVDYHTVTFPYAQETISFEGEITSGSDNLALYEQGYNMWNNLSITFRSRRPIKSNEVTS